MSKSDPNSIFLEEIELFNCDKSEESDSSSDSSFSGDSLQTSTNLPLSQEIANHLYEQAGISEEEVNNEVVVSPSPHILTTSDEQLIKEAKDALGIKFDLDYFQLQALQALLNGDNVIVLAPCGSGKLLIFYMGVYIPRKKLGMPNGVGVCLQPLNSILVEKTNTNPVLKTAFLTVAGEGVKEGNISMSHDLNELLSGAIRCLLGHSESFMSIKSKIEKQILSLNFTC